MADRGEYETLTQTVERPVVYEIVEKRQRAIAAVREAE